MRDRAEDGTTQLDERPEDPGTPVTVTGVVTDRGAAAAALPARAPFLVLTGPDGATYLLPVDGALRSAVRQAVESPAPAAAGSTALRPKDIQTRIRAGESARELAENAGISLEQVERYAGPVLAERAHMASVARGTVVRTARSRPTLEDLVRHRLAGRGVDAVTVEWDAWRRGEQGWAVQASFHAGTRERLAQWVFDPVGETVEPLDDEARWLSAAQDPEAAAHGRRLSAVRVFDVETDGGVREVPVVPGPPLVSDTGSLPAVDPDGRGAVGHHTGGHAAVPDDDHDEVAARTMDLLDALRSRRGRRQPLSDLGPEGYWDEDDEDPVDALLDLPPGAHPPASRPDEAVDATDLSGSTGSGAGHGSVTDAAPGAGSGAGEPRLRAVPFFAGDGPDTADGIPVFPADGSEPFVDGVWGPRRVPDAPETPPAGVPAVEGPWTGDLVLPPGIVLTDPPAAEAPSAPSAGPGAAVPSRSRGARGAQRTPDAPPVTGELVADEVEDAAPQDPPVKPARSRTGRRPSVPSWDEIVFGSPRTEQD